MTVVKLKLIVVPYRL